MSEQSYAITNHSVKNTHVVPLNEDEALPRTIS